MAATRDQLKHGLSDKLGATLFIDGDVSNGLPNTLSVAFEGIDAHALPSLTNEKLCISTGWACNADSMKLSRVLKAMNGDHLKGARTVRISTGRSTTKEEIDYATGILSETIQNLI